MTAHHRSGGDAARQNQKLVAVEPGCGKPDEKKAGKLEISDPSEGGAGRVAGEAGGSGSGSSAGQLLVEDTFCGCEDDNGCNCTKVQQHRNKLHVAAPRHSGRWTQGPVENGGVDWEGEVGKYCKGARYRKVASYGGVEKGIPMLDVNEI